jgi:hypothetical protein
MKKLMIALFVSGALASPAVADHTVQHEFKGVKFASRGECQSALMGSRNERRAEDARGTSGYNEYFRGRFYCDQNADGDWVVRIDND